MRALVVANPADRDPGLVGERLEERGWHLETTDRERLDQPPDLDGVDLVLSLGSDWSVYQPAVRRQVEAEAALLRDGHVRGTPVLGICWGAQVLAHALGASVSAAPAPEVGWNRVRPAQGSPVPAGPWFQWHSDRFELPAGARLLATSPMALQAFRSRRSLGVQFHAELTETMLRRWVAGARAARDRLVPDPDGLLEASAAHWDGAAARARWLVDWFLDEVARQPGLRAERLDREPTTAERPRPSADEDPTGSPTTAR